MREIKFRAWDKDVKKFADMCAIHIDGDIMASSQTFGGMYDFVSDEMADRIVLQQYTGIKDKNGVEIYEGDIVGEESVYHFLEREGWKAESGAWKIIGEKVKDFTGKGEEKYIAGYRLAVVEWRDSSCGFEPFSDSEENCGHCGVGKRSEDVEVIGNIYENPDLLK